MAGDQKTKNQSNSNEIIKQTRHYRNVKDRTCRLLGKTPFQQQQQKLPPGAM